MWQQIGAISSTGGTGRRLVWRPGNGIDNKAISDGDVKNNRIIRLSGIALIIASAGVMADAFGLTSVEITIGTMFSLCWQVRLFSSWPCWLSATLCG
jgi:hypothetical protein